MFAFSLGFVIAAFAGAFAHLVIIRRKEGEHDAELKWARGRLQERIDFSTSEVLKKNEELREVRDKLTKQLNIITAERDQNAQRLREITEVVNCGTGVKDYFGDE